MMKKDFSPTVKKLKNILMDKIVNTSKFESYIKTKNFSQIYNQMLWGEGPCYIPNQDMLVWSDNPNNRMLKLKNGKVSEFRNPSNFCNGNTIDNDQNLLSCSHGGRCVYISKDYENKSILVDSFDGKKLNSPNDIVVKCVKSVPDKFHARHNAIGKRYRYLIYNSPYRPVFLKNHSWWIKKDLDIKLMQDAANVLIGVHDFSAFRSVNCTSKNTVKDLSEILIKKNSLNCKYLQIEFEANSFLQHMVRIITGTLVEAGQARKSCDDVKRALNNGDRNLAGCTAPAYGLYSLKVIYPDGLVSWPPEVIDN